MNRANWWSTLLASLGLAWSLLAGWMIWVTPVRYLQYRSNEPEPRYVYLHFSEANLGVWVLIVPIILAGLAVSLTRRQRPFALLGLTCVFGLYCFVTGFSTGSGYLLPPVRWSWQRSWLCRFQWTRANIKQQ